MAGASRNASTRTGHFIADVARDSHSRRMDGRARTSTNVTTHSRAQRDVSVLILMETTIVSAQNVSIHMSHHANIRLVFMSCILPKSNFVELVLSSTQAIVGILCTT